MLGVPRFCESTLMCDSGVWNSSVMIPATTEMSLGVVEHDDVAEADVRGLELGRPHEAQPADRLAGLSGW